MDIVIPTLGRVHKQETAKHLARAGLDFITVVQMHECEQYTVERGFKNVHILPDHIRTIGATRDYIIDNVGNDEHIVMLDDDLVFFKRREMDRTKLRDIEPEELRFMMEEISLNLDYAPHVGIAAREGANRNTDKFMRNTRIMRVLAYDRSVIKKHGIKFDTDVMCDFHVALSLLELGYPNVVLNEYANNQFGSGAVGGCSGIRTPEYQAQAAHSLKALHPNFVTVVQKETKTAWGGGTRTDVRIQWKLAYEHGKSNSGVGVLDH